ncbi:MAG: YafY family transcriptional regulator [Anaerolineae bacterium]|nr:YafY family transcriptional regulator [Anaerolineae bacterium]
MNRTDRLLAIILELQDRKHLRAEDLAAIFEVSKRTIYRDIQALCEAGVPVVAMTGQGYSLPDGYFLPPVSFSPDEALLLILGSEVMSQNFDAQYQAAARSARRKIEAVLPDALRQQVETLQHRINFVAASSADSPASHDYLPQLRRAILERRTVRLHYHQRFPEADESPASIREVDPQRLVHRANAWYLSAYCHLRREIRHFRLDRIERLDLLPQTFAASTSPAADQPSSTTPRDLVIHVLFDKAAARWLPEARSFYIVEEMETEVGYLVTLTVRQEQEILPWLLSWGSQVRVLEPESLRRKLAEEAAKMAQNYQETQISY